MRLTFLDPDWPDLVDPTSEEIREALLNLPEAEDPRAVLEDPGEKNYMQLAIEENRDALICQVEYREYFSDLTPEKKAAWLLEYWPAGVEDWPAKVKKRETTAEETKEHGVEGHVHASCEDVELPVAVELFQSYSRGDESWRTKVDWEADPELSSANSPDSVSSIPYQVKFPHFAVRTPHLQKYDKNSELYKAAERTSYFLFHFCSTGAIKLNYQHILPAWKSVFGTRSADQPGETRKGIKDFYSNIDEFFQEGIAPVDQSTWWVLSEAPVFHPVQDRNPAPSDNQLKPIKRQMILLSQAIQREPDNASLYYLRGCANGMMGEHEQGSADLTRAMGLKPEVAFSLGSRYAPLLAQWTYVAAADQKTATNEGALGRGEEIERGDPHS